MSDNPYAAPTSAQNRELESAFEVVPASRFKRLVARIIDGILSLIVTGLLVLLIPSFGTSFTESAVLDQEEVERLVAEAMSWESIFFTGISTAAVIEWLVAVVIVFSLHGYLLAQYGQTIGKLVLGIKIVDAETHEKPPFATTFGIREVGMMLLSWFPICSLIDVLWIFGPNRRCVHDYWSQTIVVNTN